MARFCFRYQLPASNLAFFSLERVCNTSFDTSAGDIFANNVLYVSFFFSAKAIFCSCVYCTADFSKIISKLSMRETPRKRLFIVRSKGIPKLSASFFQARKCKSSVCTNTTATTENVTDQRTFYALRIRPYWQSTLRCTC